MDDSALCCLGNNLAHLMPSIGCHPHHHLVDALNGVAFKQGSLNPILSLELP